jgi:hypothetical protein
MTMSVVQLLLRVLIMLPHVTLKTIILDNNIVSKAVEVDDGPQTFRIWLSLVFPPCWLQCWNAIASPSTVHLGKTKSASTSSYNDVFASSMSTNSRKAPRFAGVV